MNNEKTGKFIRELRESKKLSQTDLANLVFVSREAVSRWERGKSFPDKSCLLKLSEIFNITIDELIFGERKTKSNKKKIENVSLEILSQKQKFKKLFMYSSILSIFLLTIFFGYYFLMTYNKTRIYIIFAKENNVEINDGVLIITNEKLFFNLGNINAHKDIEYLKLYWNDDETKRIICEGAIEKIVLYDFNGYNNYFHYDYIDKTIQNLYVDVTTKDKTLVTVKLNFRKEFVNKKLFGLRRTKITSGKTLSDLDKNPLLKYDLNKLKNKLKSSFDGYTLTETINGEKINYWFLEDSLNLIIKNETKNEKFEIFLDTNYIHFIKLSNDKVISEFSYQQGQLKCNINCKTANEIIEKYMKIINSLFDIKG